MKLTPQDALEYMGTLIIILTGIPPAADAADVLLPNWLAFTIAIAVMVLAALQKQYQRKLEREAQQQPSDEQTRQLAQQAEIIQRQGEAITRMLNDRAATQPASPFGAGEEIHE